MCTLKVALFSQHNAHNSYSCCMIYINTKECSYGAIKINNNAFLRLIVSHKTTYRRKKLNNHMHFHKFATLKYAPFDIH